MRALFLCPELRDRGGNFLVAELARRLPLHGWDVEVATLVAQGDAPIRPGSESLWVGVNIVPIHVPSKKDDEHHYYNSTIAIVDFLQTVSADVYIADGGLPPVGLRLSCKTPALVFNQALQDYHKVFSNKKEDALLRSLGLVIGLPIVTVSEPHRKEILSRYGAIECRVIEPGISKEFFETKKLAYEIQTSEMIFATSGASLSLEGKGFGLLTEGLNLLASRGHRFKLMIYSTDFRPEAFKISFPFEVRPMTSRVEMALELQKADVYLNASEYETFCLSIAEAFAVGVPAVITDAVGPAAYANQLNCHLVERRTPADFVLKLEECISLQASQREDMAQKAQRSVAPFTLERMAERWAATLDNLIDVQPQES